MLAITASTGGSRKYSSEPSVLSMARMDEGLRRGWISAYVDADARYDQAEAPVQAHRGARRRRTRPAPRYAGVPLVGPLGGRPSGPVGGRRDRPPDRQHLPPGAGRPLVPSTGRIHLVRLRDRLDRFRQKPPSEVAAAGAGVAGARMPRVRASTSCGSSSGGRSSPANWGATAWSRVSHWHLVREDEGRPSADSASPAALAGGAGPSARTLLVRGCRRLLSRREPHARAAG